MLDCSIQLLHPCGTHTTHPVFNVVLRSCDEADERS